MSKIAQPINDCCPLQSECGRKHCDYKSRERECRYYQGNARPGAQIGDQSKSIDAEQEAELIAQMEDETDPAPGPSGLMLPLPVDKLIPHPDNPRKELGDLTELADSIKTNGIFQNLTVVPVDETYETFTVVIGHRRLAAAKLAGLKEVPCVIVNMDAKEQVRTMLLENMQRSDLTVYEQAQGFQMMLDLGDSVEEIAAKSGFSKTTVRRRVKMLELDQSTLKEVSERQLSLSDFDELAKIEDTKARNACLAEIGTSNFKHNVAAQLRKQTIKKNLPVVKKLLKAAKAKAITQNDSWSNKYENVGAYSYQIADWKEGEPLIPKKVTGQLYYYLDTSYGTIRFFQERKKAKPKKRPAAEIEKEKRIAAAWNELNEKIAVMYDLRSKFVEGLTWGKKNAEAILRGALIAGTLNAFDYVSLGRTEMGKVLGIDTETYDSNRGIKALGALRQLKEKDILAFVYAMFDDNPKEVPTRCGKYVYPVFAQSSKLNGIYDWLALLGYEKSDDEQMLLDGTHELYHRGDAAVKDDKGAIQDA